MTETTVWGTTASRAKKLWRCSSGKPSFQFVREDSSVARFCSTIGIDGELSSSARTVKVHMHNIFRMLDTRSRWALFAGPVSQSIRSEAEPRAPGRHPTVD
jgi:hypothetical protein